MGLLDSGIGAIGSIIGGIAGNAAGAGDRGEAHNQSVIANEILQKLQQVPDISKPLVLEQYRQAGVLTPELEQYVTAQVPAAIKTDQRTKDAQLQALKQFQDRATQGLTSSDRAALMEARSGANRDTTSRLASIEDQMKQRGLADSGSTLAMKLAASQNGTNNATQNSNQLAQQSQMAALQAANQLGNLGGQMQAQDFGQQFQQQQAQNEMQRFNVNNQINQQARNVANQNQAQQFNLQNLQGINNANVGQNNQEAANQLQREMEQYQATQNRAALQAGAAQNYSNQLMNMGNQAAQGAYNQWSGIGQAVGGMVGALGGKSSGSTSSTPGTDAGYGIRTTAVNPKAAVNDWASLNQGGRVHDYRHGGPVPGTPKVSGDSIKNDTVPAMLSPGEIVVPRTLSESKFGKHLLKIIDAHNNLKKHMNGDE